MEERYYLYDTNENKYLTDEDGIIIYFTFKDDATIFLRNPVLCPWGYNDDIIITSDLDPHCLNWTQMEAIEWLTTEYRKTSLLANEFYDTLTEMGVEL